MTGAKSQHKHAQVSAAQRKLSPADINELHKVFERADKGSSGYVEVGRFPER